MVQIPGLRYGDLCIEAWECPLDSITRARVSYKWLKTDAKDGYYLSANLRSKYLRTPITLAASTSMAGRLSMWFPCRSLGATSRGLGRVCSLGSQVASSSLAREKLGCRDKVVKVSAHVRVKAGADEPPLWFELRVDGRDWQHPPSTLLPPQQPDEVLADREAANVLQKSVLRGSLRH